MSTKGWHVTPDVWEGYAAGRLDFPAQSAVETHVERCPDCQQAASAYADARTLERAWTAVRSEVVRPRPAFLWNGLSRVGVPDPDVAVLRASSGLHRPWVAAVLAALACGFLSSDISSQQDRVFLLLAPLIPVLAVTVVYDATDPMRELEVTTPHSKLRIALLRASAALLVALPVTTVVGLLVPGLQDLAFVWLLPGLALTLTVLVLLTRWTAWVASGAVATAWVVAVGALAEQDSAGLLDSATAQTSFALLTFVMAAVLALRTRSVHLQGGY